MQKHIQTGFLRYIWGMSRHQLLSPGMIDYSSGIEQQNRVVGQDCRCLHAEAEAGDCVSTVETADEERDEEHGNEAVRELTAPERTEFLPLISQYAKVTVEVDTLKSEIAAFKSEKAKIKGRQCHGDKKLHVDKLRNHVCNYMCKFFESSHFHSSPKTLL